MKKDLRKYEWLLRTAVAAAVFSLLFTPLLAQAKKTKAENPKDEVTDLQILVVGGPNSTPIDNASVYLRWNEHRFLRHSKQIEFDLKTDLKGIAIVKGVPRRRIIIQVVKSNWRPFGRYFMLDKAEQKIIIKLQPPPHWY